MTDFFQYGTESDVTWSPRLGKLWKWKIICYVYEGGDDGAKTTLYEIPHLIYCK